MINSLRRTMTGGGLRSCRTAVFFRRRGMPPNRVTSGFLPVRSTTAWKHLRGPYGVVMVALWRAAILDTVESCLQAKVFSSEVAMTHSTRLSRWTSPASR